MLSAGQTILDITLYITNWFSIENMAKRHNLEMWSEEHWNMIKKYAKLMRRARQTHFLVPINLVKIEKKNDGLYDFNFERTKRLIKLFLNLGFTCIEGGHVGCRTKFTDPYFVLTANRNIEVNSTEGYSFLAQYLIAWRNFLQQNGWIDKLVQHVADEPTNDSAQNYRALCGIVRKFMPGVPLIDALSYYKLGDSGNILVPTNNYYQEHMEEFEAFRMLGDKLWFYTCCVPGGHYINRFMDIPLLSTRFLHWGNYLYNLEGYLHWGFNQYEKVQDPFKTSCPVHVQGNSDQMLPPGDTHIVYPGEDGPWGSIRLEAMRAGAEDYELLKILQKKNKKLADEIAKSCLQKFDKANLDCNHFDTIYYKLLENI